MPKDNRPDLASMEMYARGIGSTIGGILDNYYGEKKVGFCLLLFEFNSPDGWSTYLSNADPTTMIVALRELGANREKQLKETGK